MNPLGIMRVVYTMLYVDHAHIFTIGRADMSSKETVFNVRVDSALKERFKTLADDHRMTMSDLMRLLMRLATSGYQNQKLTTKEPGMTRIDIPLVLNRPDLSLHNALHDPAEWDRVFGKSET